MQLSGVATHSLPLWADAGEAGIGASRQGQGLVISTDFTLTLLARSCRRSVECASFR
jgi:hypothetical protein